jgi:hypothetical protein
MRNHLQPVQEKALSKNQPGCPLKEETSMPTKIKLCLQEEED